MDENQIIPPNDKKYLLTIILNNYSDIAHCLPEEFLVKCWEFSLNPESMDLHASKSLLNLCCVKNLTNFIEILKTKTVEL